MLVVQRLAGILFEMQPLDADAHALAVRQVDDHLALAHDGRLVLADLIALRQIRIEIVLPVEHRSGATVQLSSKPVSAVRRSASSLATGNTPGKPRQTGQTCVFGAAPNSLAQPHHIFDFVLSWTCVSRPMTASYSIARIF